MLLAAFCACEKLFVEGGENILKEKAQILDGEQIRRALTRLATRLWRETGAWTAWSWRESAPGGFP